MRIFYQCSNCRALTHSDLIDTATHHDCPGTWLTIQPGWSIKSPAHGYDFQCHKCGLLIEAGARRSDPCPHCSARAHVHRIPMSFQ